MKKSRCYPNTSRLINTAVKQQQTSRLAPRGLLNFLIRMNRAILLNRALVFEDFAAEVVRKSDFDR
jgi:hypothetical protein